MRIPLEKRLKRQAHRDLAALQDKVVECMYSLEEGAVLHGGTAIWRCFQGNRFSEDLDFYAMPKKTFQAALENSLRTWNARLTKFRQTGNAIYAKVESGRVTVSLELALRREYPEPVATTYEKSDGGFLDVFTPSAEELLLEKLQAYRNRRLIRDIYDVYHLSRFVEGPAVAERTAKLLQGLPQPVDEQNLKNLVLTGAVPSFAQMMQALEKRFSP